MKVSGTSLPGVLLVEPTVWTDERGFFFESFNQPKMEALGITGPFVQDNHSRSKKNVLRGLHYQVQRPQGKLVRVVTGEVFDVAVDIRRSSPTFGKWFAARLSAENHHMMWVPPGFAHGYVVLSESADFLYKTTDLYFPQHERTIDWNDSEIRIDWPVDGSQLVISPRDRQGISLRNADVFA